MNILKRLEQTFVQIDQPANFPRLYFIPETTTTPLQHPASNDPAYHQSPQTHINPPKETQLHKFLRQEKEIFQETCADVWAALKQAGRDTVHFLARWIILPLTVASALWVPAGNPAALPL
jgi:hypothetical protein